MAAGQNDSADFNRAKRPTINLHKDFGTFYMYLFGKIGYK